MDRRLKLWTHGEELVKAQYIADVHRWNGGPILFFWEAHV